MTIAEGWVELVQDQIQVPRSARLRLTENGLTLVPVAHAHTTTARRIANQIETGLPGWAAVGEFSVVPPREGYKPEPDAAALPLDQNVLSARWSLLTRPVDGEYQHRESGVFGDQIEIPVADQTLTLDSSQFMRI